MQRIILDTNVLVSSLIQKNYPHLIVEHCFERNAIICLSEAILKEYFEVLQRPRFARFPDFRNNAEFLLMRLSEMAEIYNPKKRIQLIKDEPDNRFLELAHISEASFIISGNTKDFNFESYQSTRIVTPRTYWLKYK